MDWTHQICRSCYEKQEPGREPYAMREAFPDVCCFCGNLTRDGIYYRYDPNELRCKGAHQAEEVSA